MAYNQTLAAAGGSGGLTWTLLAGSLPGGISLSSSGTLSGTPAGSGSFPFTAKVADGAGNTATQALSLQINAPLGVTTAALPNGVQGAAYSQTLTATGGSGAYTWTVSAGGLPAGITLSGACVERDPHGFGRRSRSRRESRTTPAARRRSRCLYRSARPFRSVTSGTLPSAVTGRRTRYRSRRLAALAGPIRGRSLRARRPLASR